MGAEPKGRRERTRGFLLFSELVPSEARGSEQRTRRLQTSPTGQRFSQRPLISKLPLDTFASSTRTTRGDISINFFFPPKLHVMFLGQRIQYPLPSATHVPDE